MNILLRIWKWMEGEMLKRTSPPTGFVEFSPGNISLQHRKDGPDTLYRWIAEDGTVVSPIFVTQEASFKFYRDYYQIPYIRDEIADDKEAAKDFDQYLKRKYGEQQSERGKRKISPSERSRSIIILPRWYRDSGYHQPKTGINSSELF